MAKKDEVLSQARDAGIDPEQLAQDLGKPEASIADLEQAIAKVTGEPPVNAALFLSSAPPGTNVALAGATDDDPSLAEAELTPTQWQAHIDAYLQSPRP